ncbi:uncharacterized protein LOC121682219 [Alosa sapidissima]|uniref:uncharacterized protein LOC121682219 n=1 Tax=Alosa sapidissima TaxID=34773 RepID=UPI001C0A5E93|nr:uncharacterized protein LOC121682219 [Alosa sapidissima]XP_041918207.1 uncharacterized protein LOC121682219 [Alosa sapidissima]
MFNIPRGKHDFAKNQRRLWLQAIKRADWGPVVPKGGKSVCSAHFISGEPSFDCDSPDFVPSIFPHSTTDSTAKVARYERQRRREESRAPDERPSVMPDLESSADEPAPENTLERQYRELQEDYSSVKKELETVREENRQLKEKLRNSKFGFDSISDPALCFFTGLQTAQVFLWLLSILKRSAISLRGGLTWENHLLLVLMKIRLGLSNKDIAYRFGLPFSTVSKILREWVPLLSSVLKPLVIWPSKEAVRANLPKSFKPKFKNCRCIIDCTEIFIERTYNLKARAPYPFCLMGGVVGPQTK